MASKKNDDGTVTLDIVVPTTVQKTVKPESLRKDRDTLAAQIEKHSAGLAALQAKLAQMDAEIAECDRLEGK